MCRYAFKEYKSHFACFACRKTFKKEALGDFLSKRGLDHTWERLSRSNIDTPKRRMMQAELGSTHAEVRATYSKDVGTCPQCGGRMAPMGLDFRAPRQTDERAWTIIEALYEHGLAFQGCGCSVGYTPPKTMRDLDGFLAKHERRSDGAKLLAAIAARNR